MKFGTEKFSDLRMITNFTLKINLNNLPVTVQYILFCKAFSCLTLVRREPKTLSQCRGINLSGVFF